MAKKRELHKVYGSTHCLYSVLENQHRDLYLNQEILYEKLDEVNKKLDKLLNEISR